MQLCKVLGGMHALLGWGRCVAVLFDEETEMGLFSWFGEGGAEGGISETVFLSNELQDDSTIINPASGLPMIGGMAGVDVGGYSFGDSDSDIASCSSIDDGIFSCFCDGD